MAPDLISKYLILKKFLQLLSPAPSPHQGAACLCTNLCASKIPRVERITVMKSVPKYCIYFSNGIPICASTSLGLLGTTICRHSSTNPCIATNRPHSNYYSNHLFLPSVFMQSSSHYHNYSMNILKMNYEVRQRYFDTQFQLTSVRKNIISTVCSCVNHWLTW